VDSSADCNLVHGCDGDFVAELAQRSREHLGTFLLFSGVHFAVLLDKSHPFMQDLRNNTTEQMGNGPDGGLIAQAGQQTPEYGLKVTAFLRHRGVRCLVQHSAQVFIAFRGAIATATYSATGAAGLRHVSEVSQSLIANDDPMRQFPLRSSQKSDFRNGSL
jgi:hypothetical protein